MVAFEVLFALFLAILGIGVSVLTTSYSEWVRSHHWMTYVGWGCFFGSFVVLLAAVMQWRSAHQKLTIHRAIWYGDDRKQSHEKTAIVRGWIEDNRRIHHRVHEDELGNTPPLQAKKLEILYTWAESKNRTVVVANGETLMLP